MTQPVGSDLESLLKMLPQEDLVGMLLLLGDQCSSCQKSVWAQVQQHSSRRKLFVRSLNYATTNESLAAEFAKFGEIEEAVVIFDTYLQRSKGYGFVTFVTCEAAEVALEQPFKEIDGRLTETILAARGKHMLQNGGLEAHLHSRHHPTHGAMHPAARYEAMRRVGRHGPQHEPFHHPHANNGSVYHQPYPHHAHVHEAPIRGPSSYGWDELSNQAPQHQQSGPYSPPQLTSAPSSSQGLTTAVSSPGRTSPVSLEALDQAAQMHRLFARGHSGDSPLVNVNATYGLANANTFASVTAGMTAPSLTSSPYHQLQPLGQPHVHTFGGGGGHNVGLASHTGSSGTAAWSHHHHTTDAWPHAADAYAHVFPPAGPGLGLSSYGHQHPHASVMQSMNPQLMNPLSMSQQPPSSQPSQQPINPQSVNPQPMSQEQYQRQVEDLVRRMAMPQF